MVDLAQDRHQPVDALARSERVVDNPAYLFDSPIEQGIGIAVFQVIGDDGRQPIREGARVRVLTSDATPGSAATQGTPLVGQVVSVKSESMTVKTSSDVVVVPFKSISRLEVSHRGRNLKRGALIGGLVGFAVLTTVFVASFDAADDYSISTGESFAIGALVGAPAGGLVGLGVGALAPSWHDVPVPMTAVSRRVGLTLTIRF